MMTAPLYDFPPLIRGDSAALGVVLKRRGLFNRAVTIQPLAAGDEVRWTLSPPGASAIALSSKDGSLSLNRATGAASFKLDPAQTQALPDSTPYRLRVHFANGDVKTWLEGKLPARD